MEPSLWIIWWVLPQGHGLRGHYIRSGGLLCGPLSHLFLSSLHHLRRPYLLPPRCGHLPWLAHLNVLGLSAHAPVLDSSVYSHHLLASINETRVNCMCHLNKMPHAFCFSTMDDAEFKTRYRWPKSTPIWESLSQMSGMSQVQWD